MLITPFSCYNWNLSVGILIIGASPQSTALFLPSECSPSVPTKVLILLQNQLKVGIDLNAHHSHSLDFELTLLIVII